MEKLAVIKTGGKVIDNPDQLEDFLQIIARQDLKKILVHGGGKQIDRLSDQLGIHVEMRDGRRITDSESLEVVQMVLAGLLNKNIVAKLQSLHCNAMGLTGPDGNLIRAEKRKIRDGIDFGWVGDVRHVNGQLLSDVMALGFVPVIASLSFDPTGQILNTNADTIATEVAVAMASTYEVDLVFCFDKPGVLRDLNDNNSLIPEIRQQEYENLKRTGAISQGMMPKIENALDALERKVARVFLIEANKINDYFLGNKEVGTVILK